MVADLGVIDHAGSMERDPAYRQVVLGQHFGFTRGARFKKGRVSLTAVQPCPLEAVCPTHHAQDRAIHHNGWIAGLHVTIEHSTEEFGATAVHENTRSALYLAELGAQCKQTAAVVLQVLLRALKIECHRPDLAAWIDL